MRLRIRELGLRSKVRGRGGYGYGIDFGYFKMIVWSSFGKYRFTWFW